MSPTPDTPTIWIIEDHDALRESLREVVVETASAEVMGFTSCEAALQVKPFRIPDALILDIGLPGMSGLEAIGAFKGRYPELEIIMFTVHDEAERIFEAICAGASGYLLKSEPLERIAPGNRPDDAATVQPARCHRSEDRPFRTGARRLERHGRRPRQKGDRRPTRSQHSHRRHLHPAHLQKAARQYARRGCGQGAARRAGVMHCPDFSGHDLGRIPVTVPAMNLLPTLLLTTALPAAALVASPDFEKDVAPILEQSCLFCHNAHEAKGDLDLSTAEAALGYTGNIIPGAPEASLLVEVVIGPNPDMPKKSAPLSPKKVETLRQWIANGAPWPEGRTLEYNPERDLNWWSLRPLARPALSANK